MFAAVPPDAYDRCKGEFTELMAERRLPISPHNIRFLRVADDKTYCERVAQVSSEADLVFMGFDMDSVNEHGTKVFQRHPELRDVVFIHTPCDIRAD